VHKRQKLPSTREKGGGEGEVEIDSAASSRGHRQYVKFANFPGSPDEAALSIFNGFLFFFFVKNNFLEGINENGRNCYECQL